MNSFSHCKMAHCFFAPVVAVLLWLTSSSAVHAQRPLERANVREAFPTSTFFIFQSSNVQATTKAIATSRFGQRLSDEPWLSLSKQHQEKNIASLLNTLPWMGIEWRELETVEAKGYFVGFLDSKQKPHVVFLMQLGQKAATHPFVLAWKKAFAQNRTLKETSLDETLQISIAESKKPGVSSAVLAIGPEWTAISSSPIAIQEWVTSNAKNTLPQNSLYDRSLSKSTSESSVQYWLQPWQLLTNYAEVSEPKIFGTLEKLGLEQVTECGGEIQFLETPSPSWNVTTEVQWAQPPQDALAVLSLTEGPSIPLPAIMQGTTEETKFDNFSMLYLDNKPWFQGVNFLADLSIDENTPGGFADILDSLLTDPEGPKIDVRKEVIYKLGNPMILGGSTIPDRKKEGQYQRQLLTAFPFPDTTEMRKILQRMFEGDEEVTHEDIGDFQVWHTVHNESLFISLSESETQTITAAAVDKTHVYLATDTSWLKKLIETANQNTPGSVPEKTDAEPISIKQYFDLTSWLHRSWLRVPERTPDRKDYESTDLAALVLTNTLVPQMAASELPPWDKAKDLFGSIEVVGRKTATGVSLSITWK